MTITDTWRERDDLDRCSAPLCRNQSEIIYRENATLLNPRKILSLCRDHHERFCKELLIKHGIIEETKKEG